VIGAGLALAELFSALPKLTWIVAQSSGVRSRVSSLQR
jgi:hypothetical protein